MRINTMGTAITRHGRIIFLNNIVQFVLAETDIHFYCSDSKRKKISFRYEDENECRAAYNMLMTRLGFVI